MSDEWVESQTNERAAQIAICVRRRNPSLRRIAST